MQALGRFQYCLVCPELLLIQYFRSHMWQPEGRLRSRVSAVLIVQSGVIIAKLNVHLAWLGENQKYSHKIILYLLQE